MEQVIERVRGLESKVDSMRSCEGDGSMFRSCASRDEVILATVAAVIAILAWIYYYYDVLMGKPKVADKMDNRPRWSLGGLRDDTGAMNSPVIYAGGAGLEMTTKGAKTLQQGYDVRLGRSTYTDGKGHMQGEYSGWGTMEHPAAAKQAAKKQAAAVLPQAHAAKEGFKAHGKKMQKGEKFSNADVQDAEKSLRSHLL